MDLTNIDTLVGGSGSVKRKKHDKKKIDRSSKGKSKGDLTPQPSSPTIKKPVNFGTDHRPLYNVPINQRKTNWYSYGNANDLYWAILSDNIDLVKKEIQQGADINKVCSFDGSFPLEKSLELQFDDISGLLLECGANINLFKNNSNNLQDICNKFKNQNQQKMEKYISSCKKEEIIDLSFYFFKDLPKLNHLSYLIVLNLSYNNLTNVPLEVCNITGLSNLDLSNNLIDYLPEDINKLQQLKTLQLSNNYLSEFPKIQELAQLTNLDLSHNMIPSIEQTISQLFRLISCNLSYNYIEKIPKYLVECSGLQRFNLAHNCLNTMEGFQFHLFNSLRYLDISYNRIVSLPFDYLFQSKLLDKLLFSHNRFPLPIYRIMKCYYQNIRSLNLSSMDLQEIPESIGYLENLKHLNLSLNKLTVLSPALANLVKLEYLDLSYNKIEILPLYFNRFTKLEVLILDYTKDYITNPPKTVVERGLKSIKRHFEDLLDGEPCYRTKLMIVGQENVGKSTLLHALRQEGKKQKVKRSNISTDGIDIAKWVVKTSDKISLTFSAWDFAGQEIYYATHSFFLSSKAIYLIVWDLRYPVENARVEFWLNSVESKASNAPVILVGTHFDDEQFQSDPDKLTKVLTHVSEKFCNRHNNIRSVIGVSATESDGISQLMEILEKTAMGMTNILDKLPKIYQNLEEVVLQEKETRNPPAVTWNEYSHSIASRVNFKDEEHLLEATEFLNNLGSLVFFKSESTSEALVVLDPQWLTAMFASIITTSHNYTQNGILLKSNLPQIWRPPQYPQKMHQTLIKLLQEFEIIYQLAGDSGETKYLIPSLLPELRPTIDILWPEYDTISFKTEFNRSYVIEFVPNGLFSKLMIRFLHFIDKPLKYWRNGIIGQKGNSTGFIEVFDTTIRFITRGEGSASLLRIITEIVDTLITDWFKVRINSIYIRCPHCITKKELNPYIFDLTDCETAAAAGNIREIPCKFDKNEEYPIRLDRIVPDISMADFDGSQINYNDIVIEKTLGKGSFGVIYKGLWKGDVVAVKQLKVEEDLALEAYAEFRKEVWLMSGLRHPCIVNLLGYSTSPLVMVMECVTGGDLYGLIHNEKIEIDWHVRMKIALDMAYGMEFLHSMNPPLLHRDLKSPNVLVMKFEDGAKVIAKVADFGLSSRLFVDQLQNRAVENPTWCAPEVMVRNAYTEKADVYPFAIMMWELLTREHPYDNYRFQFQVEDDVLRGVRPEIPSNCWPEYAELMARSWDPEPDNRPDFKEILKTLIKIVKERIGVKNFRYALNPCSRAELEVSAKMRASAVIVPDVQEKITLKAELMKEIETNVKLVCITSTESQVWFGTLDGTILVFSIFSGLFLTSYVSPRGNIITLMTNNDRVWSGGGDSVGIWKIEDSNLFKEEQFKNIIKEGNVCLHSTSANSKRKFKKGPQRWLTISRDGILRYYASQTDQSVSILIFKIRKFYFINIFIII